MNFLLNEGDIHHYNDLIHNNFKELYEEQCITSRTHNKKRVPLFRQMNRPLWALSSGLLGKAS